MQPLPIQIFIVDDHKIVIDGLTALLEDEPRIKVAGTTTQPQQAANILSTLQIDVLLTDVMMPHMNGYELSKQIRSNFPQIKILALSMSGQPNVVDEMIKDADINGYVLKNIDKEELVTAIETVARGGIYFSQEVLEELGKTAHIKQENEAIHLTLREIEIIRLIEKERTNHQIANELFISERTVETHRKNIFRKTGTGSLIGLIKYAYEHKLIEVANL